jgi:hypothetical protein
MTPQTRTTFLIFLLVLLTPLLACRHLEKAIEKAMEEDKGEKARERVDIVLSAMQRSKSSTDNEMQLAMCRWYADKVYLTDYEEANEASDGFDRWRNSVGLEQVASFEVGDAVEVPDQRRPTHNVSVAINGKPYTIRVPEGYPMSWVKRGR